MRGRLEYARAMPIRPENRHRYPADWKAVRAAILQRAGHRCERPDCKATHRALGFWRDGSFATYRARYEMPASTSRPPSPARTTPSSRSS
jgi:hypothetical protein